MTLLGALSGEWGLFDNPPGHGASYHTRRKLRHMDQELAA